MQIKRLLDDRELVADDRLFDAQGRSYGFLVHSGGELVVAAALPGLSLLIWVAMWFTPTGLIEGWLRNDFVIIGKISVCSKPGDGSNWGYLWGYLIYSILLYAIKTDRYRYYSIPPPPPNISPRKSNEVLKALLIRAFLVLLLPQAQPLQS